jgi:hypothetical protein
MNAQQQEEEECSAARILVGAKRCASMNRCCSPSTASSDSDGVLNKDEANEEAVSNSTTVSEAGSTHYVSLKSESSSRPRSAHNESSSSKPSVRTVACHDVSPLPQSPLDPSLVPQMHAKRRNPLLTWTSEELSLVSQMRQGMMSTSRRKRSKKPKDAPKRPLR